MLVTLVIFHWGIKWQYSGSLFLLHVARSMWNSTPETCSSRSHGIRIVDDWCLKLAMAAVVVLEAVCDQSSRLKIPMKIPWFLIVKMFTMFTRMCEQFRWKGDLWNSPISRRSHATTTKNGSLDMHVSFWGTHSSGETSLLSTRLLYQAFTYLFSLFPPSLSHCVVCFSLGFLQSQKQRI